MINGIKALLIATGEFATVQLAQEHEPIDLPGTETPAVVLYYEKNRYSASNTDLLVYQAVEKRLICQLICHADQVDAKEHALVQAVIGYTHNAQHYPLEAVESDTHKIDGEYYSRWIVLRTQTHIRQL